MALRIDSSQNRNLYVGTGTEVAVNDGNAIVTGNVGIGTTSPGAPLHVKSATDAIFRLESSDSNSWNYMEFQGNTGRQGWIGSDNNNAIQINADNASNILLRGGNVGIGTTTPSKLLTLNDASGAALQWQYNGGNYLRIEADSGGGSYYAAAGLYHRFFTSGLERMRIDSSGNVGIGTTSPSAKLEVRGTAATYTNASTVFWGGTTNNDNHNGITLSSFGDALGGSLASNLLYSNSNTPTQTNTNRSSGQIKFGNTTIASKTSDINFGGYYKGTTTFIERMRIDSDGNVGIATTSPLAKLHVEGNIELQSGWEIGSNTGNYWQRIRTVDASADTTNAFNFETRNGSGSFINHMTILNSGNVGIGISNPVAYGKFVVQGTGNLINANANSGAATFQLYEGGQGRFAITTLNGSAGAKFELAGNEKMRIDSSGNVGIGTTNIGTESNLYLGANNSSEGGQITLQKATSGTLAAHIDAHTTSGNDYMRILSGGDTSTSAAPFVFDLTNVRVGIGTTLPVAKLQVEGTGDLVRLVSTNAGSAGVQMDMLQFSASPADDDIMGLINMGGYYSGTNSAYFSSIRTIATDISARKGALSFFTRSEGDFTEKMHITSSADANKAVVAIGITPSSWYNYTVLQVGTGSLQSPSSNTITLGCNYYVDSGVSTSETYITDGSATAYQQGSGTHAWYTAPSGTAGNGVTFTEKMRITNTGNVGIGTTSPDYKLEVESTADADLVSIKSTATTNNTQMRLGISGNDSVISGTGGSSGSLVFKTYGSERMRITSGGDLCVGVTTAQGKIHMHNSGTSYLHISNDTTGSGSGSGTDIGVFTGQSDLQINNRESASVIISTSDTPRLTIDSSGNIGIGTTSPTAKMTIDVGGGSSAPTSFTTANSYIQLGTTSYNTSGAVYAIGLGYTGGATNSPAYIGLKQTSTGSYTKGDLVFLTRDSTDDIAPTERMRITSAGNVGIGLTNPGQKLEVAGNIKAHDGYIRSEDGATGDFMQMFNDGANTGQSFITTSSTELVLIPQNGKLQLKGENYGSGNNASLEIYNALNAAVKVKLNSSGVSYFNGGNVGINQDNPLTRLDVIGSLSGSTAQQFNTRTATPPSDSTAIFRNGGNSSITILGDNQAVSNTFGSLNFGIWSDMTDGQIIYSFQNQFMAFSTANSEKLRIESGGEVGINITNPSATLHLKAIASNGVPFKLEGHPSTTVEQMLILTTKAYNSSDAWYNLVAQAGDGSGGATNTIIIERDGDVRNKNNSYGQISDSRLKENITDATPKLEDVMKVKVKNFNFIGEDLKQIGVVAQELEEVFPGLVKEDKQPDVNGEEGGIYKSVKYSVLVPILLKAMQEQQDQIEDLKTRITKLEN